MIESMVSFLIPIGLVIDRWWRQRETTKADYFVGGMFTAFGLIRLVQWLAHWMNS